MAERLLVGRHTQVCDRNARITLWRSSAGHVVMMIIVHCVRSTFAGA
jgi:hypothetical protein